jgi:hypothetical protein
VSGRASIEKRREHARRFIAKALAQGKCVTCGKPKAEGFKRYCFLCVVKQRRYCREYMARLRAAGYKRRNGRLVPPNETDIPQ